MAPSPESMLPPEQCYPNKLVPGCATPTTPLTAKLLRFVAGEARSRRAPIQLQPAAAAQFSTKHLALGVCALVGGIPTEEVVICAGEDGLYRSDFYTEFLGNVERVSAVAYALESQGSAKADGHVSLAGSSVIGCGSIEAFEFESGKSLGTVICSLYAGDEEKTLVGEAVWEYVSVSPLPQRLDANIAGEGDTASTGSQEGSSVTLSDDTAAADFDPKARKHVPPLFAGHRGLGECAATENTLASFRKATADQMVKHVELDLQVTADGVVLVHHDWKIDGEFVYTIEHEKTSPHLLTLAEVCTSLPADVGILCDIKYPPPNVRARHGIPVPDLNYMADRILDSLLNQPTQRPVALLAFDADLCVMLSLKQTEYPVCLLHCEELDGPDCDDSDPRMVCIERGVQFAHSQNLSGMVLYTPLISKDTSLPRRVSARGMSIMSYAADADGALHQLRSLGVQGVILDQVLPVAAIVSRGLEAGA